MKWTFILCMLTFPAAYCASSPNPQASPADAPTYEMPQRQDLTHEQIENLFAAGINPNNYIFPPRLGIQIRYMADLYRRIAEEQARVNPIQEEPDDRVLFALLTEQMDPKKYFPHMVWPPPLPSETMRYIPPPPPPEQVVRPLQMTPEEIEADRVSREQEVNATLALYEAEQREILERSQAFQHSLVLRREKACCPTNLPSHVQNLFILEQILRLAEIWTFNSRKPAIHITLQAASMVHRLISIITGMDASYIINIYHIAEMIINYQNRAVALNSSKKLSEPHQYILTKKSKIILSALGIIGTGVLLNSYRPDNQPGRLSLGACGLIALFLQNIILGILQNKRIKK